MTVQALPEQYQTLVNRFSAACEADDRVVAAFLGGSYAGGRADAFSDLDLGLITSDEGYESFLSECKTFIRRLGEVAFLESFNHPDVMFYIFADGIEGELGIGRAGAFKHIHGGPYHVLIDKAGILDDVEFAWYAADPDDQTEELRRLIYWFWHDVSHFITAMGRGHLWWAHGQLEVLRGVCVNLARLRHDFSAAVDNYDKVDYAVPSDQLAPLKSTFCPLEYRPMLEAARTIVRYYCDAARELADRHGIVYPAALERVFVERLERLPNER